MIIIKYGSGAAETGKKEGAEEGNGSRMKEGILAIGKSLARHIPLKETLIIAGVALASQALPSCALDLAGKYGGNEDIAAETDAGDSEAGNEMENEQGDIDLELPNESPLEENDVNEADIDAETQDEEPQTEEQADAAPDLETDPDAPAEVEGEPDASVDPDVTMDPDVTTDPDVEIIPDVAPEDFGAEDVTAEDGPADVVFEDGPCSVYTETQTNVTMHLGTPVTVGNASIVYAEEISVSMDRFEVSYCDGTVVDNNFRVGESSGTNRDYPAYTFRVSIRNRGSTGGDVLADITITDY